MSQIVLHIGTHKTGTTSIQRYLASQRNILLSHGILYPTSGCPQVDHDAHYGHHLLAWSLRNKNGIHGEKHWLDILAEIDSTIHNVAVISSEDFEGCSEEQIEQIGDYFAGRRVRVVVYVRNQFDYTISRYKQNVKSGKYYRSFRTFMKESVGPCDYNRLVDRWVRCFGAEQVEVVVFERAKRSLGIEYDFVRRIHPCMEGNDICTPNIARANVSPDDDVVAVVRLLNAAEDDVLMNRYARQLTHKLRRNILRQTERGKFIMQMLKPFVPGSLYSEEDRAWLREAVKPFNAEFLPKHVAPEDWMYFEI